MRYPAHLGILVTLICGSSASFAGELGQLDFMTGHWRGDVSGSAVEEWWSPATGATKIAAFRWATGGETNVIELVVISEEENGVFLRFKHFNPDYSTWEEGEPNAYELVSVAGARAEFRRISSNAKVPRALVYARDGDRLIFRGTNDPEVASHPDDLNLAFDKAD